MNTLTELNNFSATVLDLTDQRPAGVVFDRVAPLYPLDQDNQILSTVVSVVPGIEIVEIINHSTANVRLRVTVVNGGSPALTGSTVNFGTLPSGLSLSQVGDVYTISGITTLAQWNAIKYFTWTLPANYASCPLWYLDVAILYYDGATSQERVVDWEVYDPDNYYISLMSSQFTQSTIIGNKKELASAMTASTLLDCPGSRVYRFNSAMTASTSMSVSALDLDLATAVLSSSFSLGVVAQGLIRNPGAKTLTAVATASITATEYNAISNMITRNYTSNTENAIFATSTPYIEDPTPLTSSFTITLTASQGEIGTVYSSSSSYTFTGTMAEVNAQFTNIRYYPPKNYTSNTTFTYVQEKNGSTQITKTVNLTYASAGTIPTATVYKFITAGTSSWTPKRSEYLYMGYMDYLVIGAGGGYGDITGGTTGDGGGGGGGEVLSFTNVSLSSGPYAYTIGAGGGLNSAGSNTTFNSSTAVGGASGSSTRGGASGSGTYLGGLNVDGSPYQAGGGGGGAGTTHVSPTTLGTGEDAGSAQTPGDGGYGYRSYIESGNPTNNKVYAWGGAGGTTASQAVNSPAYSSDYDEPGSGGWGARTSSLYPATNFTAIPGKAGGIIIRVHQ